MPPKMGPMTKQQAAKAEAKRARRAARKAQGQVQVQGQAGTKKWGKSSPRMLLASGPRDGGSAAAYMASLASPFSEKAVGARVPEPFAVRTKTTHNSTLFTVTAPPSGTVSFVVLPNPINTVISGLNGSTIAGGQDIVTFAGNPMFVTGAVGCAGLEAALSSYRIVGMGVRIKPNVSYTTAQGRFIVALVPSVAQAPFVTTSGTTLANLLDAYGLPVTTDGTNVAPSILSLPKSLELSHTDLLAHGGLEVNFPVTSADAWRFKTTTYGKYTIGGTEYTFPGATALPGLSVDSSVSSTTGIATVVGLTVDPDASSLGGFSTLAVYGEGLGSGTTFTLETIMHLEGVPPIATGTKTSGVLVDDSMLAAVSSPLTNMLVAQKASAEPSFTYVDIKETAKSVVRGTIQAATKSGVGYLAGQMMGLMM